MSTDERAGTGHSRSRGGRQARGLATRERILKAATALFVRDGYLATTMAAIATESDVAVQSLYLRFGSKLAILRAARDVAIVGDLEPVPLLEREWVKRLADTEDGPQAVRLFLDEVTRIFGRTYPITAVLAAAAASEAGELLAENKSQRHAGNRVIAGELSRKSGFAAGLSVDIAADLIFALASEDHYGLLVVDRGWSPAEWERWCGDILVGILFPPQS